MNRFSRQAVYSWASMGTRFLPFADVATAEVPLSRLLRLSLFQVSVGMALVMLVGTLNRVMIVELSVPASLVGVMLALPLLFAPLRTLIGYKSDTHRSALGWRRVPFIWKGTMLQFGGFAVMPFALLVLAKQGQAAHAPEWLGLGGAAIAFLMVGAGMHIVQTVGLALATDLTSQENQPKVVGLMYVMLLVGMVIAALVFGALLVDFTPGRLIQVIQGCAVVTLVLNVIAMWKQEARRPNMHLAPAPKAPEFADAWREFIARPQALRRLIVIGLGTAGFGMSDVLLEPFGGQILNLTVANTTTLTALLAAGTLVGFGLASRILSRGGDALTLASQGAMIGIPAFLAVIGSAPAMMPALFVIGTLGIGLGAGLFSHGTLTATIALAPRDQAGLALGAWGAVQATAGGVGIAAGGLIRDGLLVAQADTALGAAMPYVVVYGLEVALLFAAIVIILPMISLSPRSNAPAE
jgi:MFS transporter, BCD family, chlorophyll transporter